MDRRSVLCCTLLAIVVTVAACPGTDPADDDTGDDDGPPPDLGAGSWTVENVASTSSIPPLSLVLPPTGAPALAWEQGDVMVGRRDGGGWSIDAVPPPDPSDVCGGASLLADGGTLHLVHTCLSDQGAERVFYRRDEGQGWSAPVELSAEDPDTGWAKFSAAMALGEDGVLTVAYSAVISPTPDDTDSRIRVVHVVDGVPDGSPELVLDAPGDHCWTNDVVRDRDGADHVLGLCVPPVSDRFHVLASRGPDGWTTRTTTAGLDGRWGALALDPDGLALHLTWEIAEPFVAQVYHERNEGAAISSGVLLDDGAGLFDLAVDRHGRPVALTGGSGTLRFSYSDDGGQTFSSTPMTFGADEWPGAGSIALDPETDLPRFAFDLVGATYAADVVYAIYELD